ncbi:Hypothetical predicted protein [Marmota monax]|uniref:Uncharacterized protein n=1 Tax=Marmota monax TaxID=9995 RepID=A0A5E4CCM5_MARMO|nr:Hypothetical predicted protein [Marmota monax]
MDPPQKCSPEYASYQSLGIGELTEKVQDKKPAKISVIVKGGDDHGQKIRSESEQGATAEVCYTGAGALGPVNQKGGGDEKPRLQQLKEPCHEAAEGSQSGDTDQSDFCNKFSQLQLQELDRFFQRTDVEERCQWRVVGADRHCALGRSGCFVYRQTVRPSPGTDRRDLRDNNFKV